ncbi:MAG: inositol monophosphatase family protein [Candidatus Diapherotrites archaeon]|nr:inositol monophosphatase family protein [Candidatus Diapherotrites archaeon]
MKQKEKLNWQMEFLRMGKLLRKEITSLKQFNERQKISGISKSGDPQFKVDNIAENFLLKQIKKISKKTSIAYFSEDKGLVRFAKNPEYLLICDPIDGSRPFSAGFESNNFSIALAETNGKDPTDLTFAQIVSGFLLELKTGEYLFAEKGKGVIQNGAKFQPKPTRFNSNNLNQLFWSFEFNGTPSRIVHEILGDLIDTSANKGGIFVFNSGSYSISRVITGQLHAYIDIGNLVLKKFPELEKEFKSVGSGSILHLFPYDIAASYIIAKEAHISIADAAGNSLESLSLTDLSAQNQTSCVCALNEKLSKKLINEISVNLEKKRKQIAEEQ